MTQPRVGREWISATGVTVKYEGDKEFEKQLPQRAQSGTLPDIILIAARAGLRKRDGLEGAWHGLIGTMNHSGQVFEKFT